MVAQNTSNTNTNTYNTSTIVYVYIVIIISLSLSYHYNYRNVKFVTKLKFWARPQASELLGAMRRRCVQQSEPAWSQHHVPYIAMYHVTGVFTFIAHIFRIFWDILIYWYEWSFLTIFWFVPNYVILWLHTIFYIEHINRYQQISTDINKHIRSSLWQSPGSPGSGCSMAIGNTFRCLNRVNWRYCILRHGFGVGGSEKICSAAECWHRCIVCARNWRGRIACLCWNNCSRSFMNSRCMIFWDVFHCFPMNLQRVSSPEAECLRSSAHTKMALEKIWSSPKLGFPQVPGRIRRGFQTRTCFPWKASNTNKVFQHSSQARFLNNVSKEGFSCKVSRKVAKISEQACHKVASEC